MPERRSLPFQTVHGCVSAGGWGEFNKSMAFEFQKNTVTPHGRGVSSAVESGTRMVPSGKGKGSQKVPALKGPKPGPWHPAGLSKTHLNQGFLKHPKGRAGAGMDFTVKEEPEDINESCEDEPLSVQDEVGGDVYQYDLPQRNNKQIIWSGGSTGKGKKVSQNTFIFLLSLYGLHLKKVWVYTAGPSKVAGNRRFIATSNQSHRRLLFAES